MFATLTDILESTRRRVRRLADSRGELEKEARRAPATPSWRSALEGAEVRVIAELKRRSPSAGAIRPDLDPGGLARSYTEGGAHAISVLTESDHFGGSLDDLRIVRAQVSVPVLRKDFILDPVQVYEAKVVGASAVLLIVRVLEKSLLGELHTLAADLGLGTLVEVHDPSELEAALAIGAASVGVNSRDLTTFEVNVAGMRDVLRAIPSGTVAVAESGLARRADVERVAAWGADAVLVGTALARSDDPAGAVRALVGVPRAGRGS
jgi:indole-3-glycerol phosphate synthase